MKITPYRTSFIVDRSFRLTLLSTTLTALAPLIASLVDGLICSHLVCNDAFIAVSVTLPIINAVNVLSMICCRGGAMLAAGQLAKGDSAKASRIFTLSLISAVSVVFIVAFLLWMNADSLSLSLAGDPVRATYVRNYLQVILIYLFIIPFNATFNDFATQQGLPQITTKSVGVGCFVNVVLDVILVEFFNMGVQGTAWGTVASGLINLFFIFPFFLSRRNQCHIVRIQGDTGSILRNNLKHGFGFNIFYIVVNGFMLLGNALVLRIAGSEGLTLFDVCLQIQSSTFSVTVGLCIAGISHISYMRMNGDGNGLKRIMHNIGTTVVAFYGVLTLLMVFFPSLFMWLFGVDDEASVAMARRVFSCFGIYYFCFCVVSVYVTVVLQLAGHVGAKIVLVFSMGILTYLCMWGLSFASPDAMWFGLVLGGVPILLASLGFGYWQHRKHPEYTTLTLVDKYPNCIKFECSLDYEYRHMKDMDRAMRVFADTCEMPQNVYEKICATGKSLYEDALRRKSHNLKYLDFFINELDSEFQVTVKDCGKPYDPASNGFSAEACGALSVSYRYMFAMNVTTIKWPKR